MKIIKQAASDIPKEDAHGGAGSRRLYIDERGTPSNKIQGMTHGWLPAGACFDWHEHKDIEEVMYVIKGSGDVYDLDGKYTYEPGDVFIFPANTQHKIENESADEHEFIFIRIYV